MAAVGIGLMVLGWILMLPAYRGWVKGKKELRELRKYEFEHRSTGGVVEFKTFEDSEEHTRRLGQTGIGGCSAGIGVIGAILAIIGVGLILFRILGSF
jgi:hypothetical protein